MYGSPGAQGPLKVNWEFGSEQLTPQQAEGAASAHVLKW